MRLPIAVLGDEDVSPTIACTCTGLVHGVSEFEDVFTLSLFKARATFMVLGIEPQVS